MKIIGKHDNPDARPERASLSENTPHVERAVVRIPSVFEVDRSALAMYPALLGRLGTFEVAPEFLPYVQGALNPDPESRQARGVAEVGEMLDAVPTQQFAADPSSAMPAAAQQLGGEVTDVAVN